jgi:hypothetical protein
MRAYLETVARRTARGHLFNGCRRLLPLLAGVLRKRPAGVIVEPGAAARAGTADVLAEAGAFVAVGAAARGGLGGEPVRGRAGRASRTRAGPAVPAFRAHRCLGGGGDGGCPFGLRPWALPPRSELPGEPPRPAPCPGRGSAGFLTGVLFSLPATGCLPCSARLLTAWLMTPVTVTDRAIGFARFPLKADEMALSLLSCLAASFVFDLTVAGRDGAAHRHASVPARATSRCSHGPSQCPHEHSAYGAGSPGGPASQTRTL